MDRMSPSDRSFVRKPVPCDDCSFRSECAARAASCRAFNRYAAGGSWRHLEWRPTRLATTMSARAYVLQVLKDDRAERRAARRARTRERAKRRYRENRERILETRRERVECQASELLNEIDYAAKSQAAPTSTKNAHNALPESASSSNNSGPIIGPANGPSTRVRKVSLSYAEPIRVSAQTRAGICSTILLVGADRAYP
jgi:hypothetical protein